MDRPYTIWTPGYSHMSGGIRALYQLKKEFDDRGIESYFHNEKRHPEEIMIYPEIVQGNPDRAKRVVRWLLNKADFPGDICYAWEKNIGKYPLLTTNIVEMDIWTPSQKTNKVAYWVGKGEYNDELVPDDAYEISRRNYTNRKDLANFISTLDYLISFDLFSIINLEAPLCGTPVLLIDSGNMWNPSKRSRDTTTGWSKSEFDEVGWVPYGIAWNYEELEKAREEVHLARPHYESLLPVFQKRIDNFITDTQKIF